MADAAVSAVVELLFTVVKDQIQNEIQLVRGVDKELLDLSDELKTIKNVLEDADTRRFKEKTVEDWLLRLEQTSYEMEDVLKEWNYALIQHKIESQSQSDVPPKQKVCSFLSSCFSLKELGVRHDIAKKVQDLKSRLDKILKEKDRYNFAISQPKSDPPPASSWRVQSDSSIDLEEVQGRKDDKDILVGKLTANGGSHEESGYQIHSIVGAGGLGKTTLAQLVYNDSRVKACFHLTIWLCVSDPFDVVAIAKGIIEKIKRGGAPNTNQLDVVLGDLKDSISGKKILLVLDDVWNEQEEKWKPLKNALKCGGASSKVLVTTRKMAVAKIMGTLDEDVHRPELMSDEECWLLMRRLALSGKVEIDHEYFEETGKMIAKKCNGLPLAAKTLGSVLRSKNTIQEWENVLKSEIWELNQVKVELFPHLLLSYHELSPALKHCFSYCAIFPKDKKIDVDELIRLWMAMDYLGSSSGTTGDEMELRGRDYFKDLAMRSLFQDFDRGSDGQTKSCKMHDIVHDFAQFLRNSSRVVVSPEMNDGRSCKVCDPILVSRVKEYRSLIWNNKTPSNWECLARLKVLRFKNGLICGSERMETLIHLQWLDISGTKLSKECLKRICKLYFLQTLLLRECLIEEIPSEIGNLVDMRYLDLSFNIELKELPDSICSLLQLQTLNVEECMNLSRFPKGVYRLESLKHLFLRSTPLSRCFPQELGELTGLRTLRPFIVGSGWSKMGLLKKLNSLTGFLALDIRVSGSCDQEELIRDAVEAELKKKTHLQRFTIMFNGESTDEVEPSSSSLSLWVDLVEALEPYHKVQEITLWNYKGCRLPHWISSPLNRVRDIHLFDCLWVSSLPSLGKLPFLESLYMNIRLGVKEVGAELLGIRESSTAQEQQIPSSSTIVAFPKLNRLTFVDLRSWEEWEDITAEEEESEAIQIMPSLVRLEISFCPKLKKLPHLILSKAHSLRYLNISHSVEVKKYYEDEDGKSAIRSMSLNNTQLSVSIEHQRITHQEILRATSHLDEENLIGRGGYGSVYKGNLSDGSFAAVKVFNLDVQGALKSFDTECEVMRSLRHRNLVKVITSCSNLDFKALVMEYMPQGNLENLLYSDDCILNISQLLGIMIDVASALKYLHEGYSFPIVHCDLKPRNILLDEDTVAHVGDFGIAKLLTEEQRMHQTRTMGTIGYMAPEYGSEGFITTMVDVYSFGILLMETISRRKPTDEMFREDLSMRQWMLESLPNSIEQVVDNKLLNMDDDSSNKSHTNCLTSIIGLALECTKEIPEKRPSIKDVLVKIEKMKLNLSNHR